MDDEELVRLGTAEMLEAMGHEVKQAASGAAAIQCLRGPDPFDLIVADYMMPGMSGVELVEEARRLRPRMRALLITGYAGLDASGAKGLAKLAKPYGEAELAGAIAQVTAGTADA